MPKYYFIKKGKKFNKEDLTSSIFQLYDESKSNGFDENNQVKKEMEKLIAENADKTLRHFISKSKEKFDDKMKEEFINSTQFKNKIRNRAISSWLSVLEEHAYPSPELTKMKELLNNKNLNKNYSISDLSIMVKKYIDPKYYDEVKSDEFDFIYNNDILDNLDKYVDLLTDNLTDDVIVELGNVINDFHIKFDYKNMDVIENPINDKNTNELINDINSNNEFLGKKLNKEEIDDYINSLNYCNNLFLNNNIDYNIVQTEKMALERGVTKDLDDDVDIKIANLGFSPNAVRATNYKDSEGFYLTVAYGREHEHEKNVSESEMKFSDKSKEGIKLILSKLKEFGFCKLNEKEDESNTLFGLNFIIEAAKKYKDAIESNDQEIRKKAPIYAKELRDIDVKTKELLVLIERYLPVNSLDNLAFDSNLEIIKNPYIPTNLKTDYIKLSALQGLNNIESLIEKKNWNIDEFLNSPLKFIKETYKNDYLEKIKISNLTKGKTGNDLLFSIATKKVDDFSNYLSFNGIKIVNSLANLENDSEMRLNNYAMYTVFNRDIDQPYYNEYVYREILANDNSLDRLIINPNLGIEDLGVAYYDASKLKIENDALGFDEIRYIKDRTESFKEFKDRLDLSILDFMNKELNLIKDNQDPNSMFIKTDNYLNLASKAVLKMLILRRNEKNDPEYNELESLIKNKKEYVDSLINRIGIDKKFDKFIDLKNDYNKEFNFNNKPYSISKISSQNKYSNILNTYDNFVTKTKDVFNRVEEDFVSNDRTTNTRLSELYNQYLVLNRKYENEVKKIYGNNFKGIPDSTRNDKISDAFIKRNEAFKEYNSRKNDYIRALEAKVRYGRVPLTYYMQRMEQLNNHNYKGLPPYFGAHNMISRDDYIKSRYSGATLTDEQKDYLYNEFKNLYNEKENDFFSKTFLESKNLTKKRAYNVDLGVVRNTPVKINKYKLEAKFLGISDDDILKLHIGENNHFFDEISYINTNSITTKNFKNNLDKLLLNYLKEYKLIEKNHKALNERPKLEDIIDIGQKAALKYVLIGDYSHDSSGKELKNFVIDAKGYINKLLEAEKDKINSNQSELDIETKNIIPTININDLNINDFNINQDSNRFNEFESYYNGEKNETIPYRVLTDEEYYNEKIQTYLDNIEEINEIINDPNNSPNDIKVRLKNVFIGEGDDEDEVIKDEKNPQLKIAKIKLQIIKYKDKIKTGLEEAYKDGELTDYYMNERFRRLDNNDLRLPSLYKILDVESMNDYINKKYHDFSNELSSKEKTDLYNNYKNGLEIERRRAILTRYLTNKDLTIERKLESKAYQNYKANRPNDLFKDDVLLDIRDVYKEDDVLKDYDTKFINRVNFVYDNKVINDHNIIDEKDDIIIDNKNEKIIADNTLDKFIKINEKLEKEEDLKFDSNDKLFIKDDSFDLDEKNNDDLDIKLKPNEKILPQEDENELNEKLLYWFENQKPSDIIYEDNKETPESMFIKSFINVIKERIGANEYDGKSIDDTFKFDPKYDFFESWVEANSTVMKKMFGNQLPEVFKESVDRLSPDWKLEFEKAYYKHNNSVDNNEYYVTLFGPYDFKFNKENNNVKFENYKSKNKIDLEDVAEKFDDFNKQLQEDIKENDFRDSFDDKEEELNIIDTKLEK